MDTLIDLHDPGRVDREPDDVRVLFSSPGPSGDMVDRGFRVSRVELRLYREGTDERRGRYSLITAFVRTDRGSVETAYDEGFRGDEPLEQASELLVSSLGLSGLILRSTISLRGAGG